MKKSAKDFDIKGVLRIIDANANRAKEGMRVCEEVARFYLNSSALTLQFKKIRHSLDGALGKRTDYILERSSPHDVGSKIHQFELKRGDIKDIFLANIQRAKESIRVLEEFFKLKNKKTALEFKKSRYAIYELEKKVIQRIRALYNTR